MIEKNKNIATFVSSVESHCALSMTQAFEKKRYSLLYDFDQACEHFHGVNGCSFKLNDAERVCSCYSRSLDAKDMSLSDRSAVAYVNELFQKYKESRHILFYDIAAECNFNQKLVFGLHINYDWKISWHESVNF